MGFYLNKFNAVFYYQFIACVSAQLMLFCPYVKPHRRKLILSLISYLYLIKCAHAFDVLDFLWVYYDLVGWDLFTHIFHGCFIGIWTIVVDVGVYDINPL